MGFLAARPGVWPVALVPAALLLLLSSIFIGLSLLWLRPWLLSELAFGDAWYQALGQELLTWLLTGLAGLLGWLIALWLTGPLSSPALEKLVAACEQELGIVRRPIGFFREMWLGLRAQIMALACFGPPILALSLLDLIVPGAAFITLPLRGMLASLALSFSLLDYPLTLYGVRIRRRFFYLKRHWLATLGFGLVFSLLFWVPCFGVLMLPVGVVAATILTWELAANDPVFDAELTAGAARGPLFQAGSSR